jgi:glycosyltransferase involved in cell wall biosynthesis
MRIGLILRGGVEEGTEERNPFPVFVDFIRSLSREHEVWIFSLHGPNEVALGSILRGGARPHSFAGANVFQLGTVRTARLRIATDFVRVLALVRSMPARGRPEVLHGVGLSAGVVATLVGRALGIPSIVSLIGGELTRLPDIGYGELRTARGRAFVRIPLRYAHAITVASKFMQTRVHAHGAGARLMPFGVDARRFTGSVARADGPPFRLLHVGTLCPVKDQRSLMRAMRLVLDSGVDVELDIVGKDDCGGAVQREATALGLMQRIRFHEWAAREDLLALYRSAHVFVMTSVDDVAPVVVLEAAATGLPVVGTDVGFIADWAPHRAVKAPIGDPEALARAICRLVAHRDEREAIAHRGQKWVREHASLDANDAYVTLYQELAAATTGYKARGRGGRGPAS